MSAVRDHIERIRDRITMACDRAGRNPAELRLLLATKTVNAADIREAFFAGQTLIGENKMQEVKEKFEALKDVPHETHFIGHLQTNKIKDMIRYGVSCIQSLDRPGLAAKLQDRLSEVEKNMDVLIQVNTSGEASKFGVSPEQAADLVRYVAGFDRLHIRGLMTIGLFDADAERVKACFQRLRHIRDEIMLQDIPGVSMKELSMGMSNDLELAIAAGATIVRVGTAIFGKRQYPDSYYWNENK